MSRGDTTRAFCQVCKSWFFSSYYTGVIQIKEHTGRLKLINKHQQYSKQKNSFFGKPAATSSI